MEELTRADTAGEEWRLRINYGGSAAAVALGNGTVLTIPPYGLSIERI